MRFNRSWSAMGGTLASYFLQNFIYSCLWDVGLKARLAVVFQHDISAVFQQRISDISISHYVCLLAIEIDSNLQLRSAK